MMSSFLGTYQTMYPLMSSNAIFWTPETVVIVMAIKVHLGNSLYKLNILIVSIFELFIYLFITVHIQGGTEHCITHLWYKMLIIPKPYDRLCPNNPH